MTDTENINEESNSQTMFFEKMQDEELTFNNKAFSTDIIESQNFQLIDSNNTEDLSEQNNSQIHNSMNITSKSEEVEAKCINQNIKKNHLLLNNFHNQTYMDNETKIEKFGLNIEENVKDNDDKHKSEHNKEKNLVGDVSENSIILNDKSYTIFNKKSLKRKASISNKEVSKSVKILKNNSLNEEQYKINDTNKINNSNVVVEIERMEKFQNQNQNFIDFNFDNVGRISVNNKLENIKICANENKNNDSKLPIQTNLSTNFEQIRNLDSEMKDDIRITINQLNKSKTKLFMDCNSAMSNNDDNNVIKVDKNLEYEMNYPEDNSTFIKKNIKSEFSSITSNSNLEVLNKCQEIENLHNVFLNKKEKSCSIKKPLKSRMSIEVIYDKATVKPQSKELVEINENGEEIILDFSQEDINSKIPDRLIINDDKTIYESCIDKIRNKNSHDLIKHQGPVLNILKPNVHIQNEKNDCIDDVSNICYNDKLLQCSNEQRNIQTSNELNFISNSLKTRNSIIVTISDSDNSITDDYGKNNYLNSKLNQENLKITQMEKEINFNVKLKCLISIDENTKEIYQKEVVNASCEHNVSQLLHQKIDDASSSTACLADISASDNKDSSPASVNSIPQMYNLQPSRLSFVSTVSSSSSASCALSFGKRKINKDTQFSYPQCPAKYVKKYVNDLSSEDKQNWDAFEKLTKDWKNSNIIISAITNFLNEGITFDCDNGSSDLLENSQTLRSSTPELEIKEKLTKKSTIRNIKKPKLTKHLKNSKNISKDNELLNLFATPLLPIKELKTIENPGNTSTSEIYNEFRNKEVFAKWSDNNYYPGKVSDIVKMKYKVKFFDGKTKLLLPDFILPINENLETGFSAYAYINEDKYASSVMIIGTEKQCDKVFYIVETDEGKKIKTVISNIFLTSDQAKLLREQVIVDPLISSVPQQLSHVSLDNVISNKRRSKRVTTSIIHKSKSKRCSINTMKINDNNDVFKPSASGMQNRFQHKFDSGKEKQITKSYKEDKQLLEVQSEIIGTLNEQIIKGPTSKVKSKVRNRKKMGSLENVEILGPVPEVNSNIFKGMAFILSCISPDTLIRYHMTLESNDSNSEPGTENEEDWIKRPFIRNYLQAQISAGGGKMYDNFEDIPPEEYPNTKHITNVPNLTKTSLLCLSVGIRSYNHQWVIRSCQQNKAIQPAEEELPAGWSLDKQAYIDTYQRPKNKPLEHTIVAIPLIEFGEKFVEFWKKICENAGASVQILENPAKSFMEATVVLSNKNCPFWVIEQAENWQIPVLSTTWVTQCLIEGRLCSSGAKKEYKCSIAIS